MSEPTMPKPDAQPRLSRRDVFKWFAATAAALQAGDLGLLPAGEAPPVIGTPVAFATGYGTDPKLNKTYKPGDCWPLTFTAAQRETAIALADAILPADDLGPAASELRVVDYIDEWVSAPYPAQQADTAIILPGLAWLEQASTARFQARFAALKPDQQRAICDEICFEPNAKPELKEAAKFFARFRSLAAGAYFATVPGWKAIGYVGNVPTVTFAGPPAEVLAKLDVEQTVK